MSERTVPDYGPCSKTHVYDLDESVAASKYPMLVDTAKATADITETVKSLAASPKGEGHDQFLTGIVVNFDLRFSIKAWVEAERYRFLNFVSSQSTMHRVEKMLEDADVYGSAPYNRYVTGEARISVGDAYTQLIKRRTDVNRLRLLYNLPLGTMLTARMTTNYRALKTIYSQRRNHRLPEWREFCKWVETLPLASELIIGTKKENS